MLLLGFDQRKVAVLLLHITCQRVF